MASAHMHPTNPARPALTPSRLVHDFGARAAVTREGVCVLHEALRSAPPAALAGWRSVLGKWAGRALERVPRHLAQLARRYGISTTLAGPDALLLVLQTYYALLVNLVSRQATGGRSGELLPDNPFSWYSTARLGAVDKLVARLTEALAGYCIASPTSLADGGCDLFKPLYQDLFPRALRHQLGEYYTPDWLARHVLDQVGYVGQAGMRLLDPACGSGTFLLLALERISAGAADNGPAGAAVELPHQRGDRLSSLPPLSPPIVGFDVNPLAVMTARANYLIALADVLPDASPIEPPIYLYDAILGAGTPPGADAEFDYVVGNPPWIAWDNLSDEDRQATKPLWEHYGLFSLSGNEARHGGGKKDLSMLMLYAAADRYLKPGGRLGMVITQTLFQTKGAGDGFRRFQLGRDGPPLGVLRVDDMVALRPFGDAANWTSTIVLQKGAATVYPVPYIKWDEERGGKAEGGRGSLVCIPCQVRPIDTARPNSPWLVVPDGGSDDDAIACGASDYTAHLGANSGGANGVYWVELLEAAEGGVLVRNVAARGKHKLDTIEAVIEPDLLYPLLRWSDVRRYAATPQGCILLAQDPIERTGIAEGVMCERYPRTLAYLERFRGLLTSRAAYRRYQQSGPFYSMYNVGTYTLAPVKVVWRRMDRRLNAAVVEETDYPLLGRRPVIPQETCVLVACDSTEEAHYVCAVLNSAIVNDLVSACSVCGGKGFGTPSMLEFVPLRRFEPENRHHLVLASLGRQAQCEPQVEEVQREIDRAAAALFLNCSSMP